MNDWIFYSALVLLIGGIITAWSLTANNGKSEEIRSAVGVTTGITIAIMLVFGAVAYYYFSENPQYGYPYLLFTNTLAIVLSMASLAVSTINVQWSPT
jgi:hypothetical protein